MSSTYGLKNTSVTMFGYKIVIPDNSLAKIMYYLNCVAVVIDFHDSVLVDYQIKGDLSGEQLLRVYDLAKLLNPSIFLQYKIFILDQGLLLNEDNQFYEINDEKLGFQAFREIMIEGKLIKVLKLMACNPSWLGNFYYRPIQEIETLIRNYKKLTTKERKKDVEPSTPIVRKDFKNVPIDMNCYYCKQAITTETETKLNLLACVCGVIFNLSYCIFQMCRGKAIWCCDFKHRCPKCGRVVGEYNAC